MDSPTQFTIPPCSPHIPWDHDLRDILSDELEQARYREEHEPYYRGESWTRPAYLDHPDETNTDADDVASTGSETIAADSDRESDTDSQDGYVAGDAPVHAEPRRWSSNFMRDCGPYGTRPWPPRTPSPPPAPTLHPLTHTYSRAELEHHQFQAILDWEGPTPVVDTRGRVVGILVDGPCEKIDYLQTVRQATAAIDCILPNVDYSALPARGNTPTSIRWGMEYYGWGPWGVRPQNVRHESLGNLVEISLLRHSQPFREISLWQNTVHQRFGPRLHAFVDQARDTLLHHDPTLRDNVTGGAYPCVEFFLGNPESPPRLDDLDMIWTWRMLTALGVYNARWGGELILWDEKKVIRFPPGATFLFPAAFMRYSFTQVRVMERQYAFSQYAQAGLFRYIDNGFKSEMNFEATAWRAEYEGRERAKDARVVRALGMYSLLDEVQ